MTHPRYSLTSTSPPPIGSPKKFPREKQSSANPCTMGIEN